MDGKENRASLGKFRCFTEEKIIVLFRVQPTMNILTQCFKQKRVVYLGIAY